MDTYTLKVEITKIRQGTGGSDDRVEHSVVIKSHNLTLEETVDMQQELAPALQSWVKNDTA